jgi:putative glutamine amidotransferase
MPRPVIGITCDNWTLPPDRRLYGVGVRYVKLIAEAGGVPIVLSQFADLAERYAELCDGVVFTGGDDVCLDAWGEPPHPACKLMDPQRQAFDLALLAAMDRSPRKPVLGVCLGMQEMALHAGGRIFQHLPDVFPDAQKTHQGGARHTIEILLNDSVLTRGLEATHAEEAPHVHAAFRAVTVPSYHHQGVRDAGRLRVVAKSPDGLTEVIDDPARPFYLGVQWHPERGAGGGDEPLNRHLLARFVAACR